ncbi:MAG TPA: sigma-70 family RNA polymerase sigma factor [Opitutaceae bacterium]
MLTDAELLQRYVRERDEPAFTELVRRHLGVVYGAALRRTGGRTQLAEEVAQKIFTDLARKAATLSHHPALIGWLHRSTRYAAIDAARAELRGQKLSQALATMSDIDAVNEPPVEWERLRPVLDEAMDQLKEPDREAMLLRYFEGLSFAEVGARLNLTENAARMRTERALDKLRHQLGRRGVTSTAAALGVLLGKQVLATSHAGLVATVSSAALAATPATPALVALLLMNKLALPTVSALVAAGVTTLLWTSLGSTVTSESLAALRAENARLALATAPDASAEAVAAVAGEYASRATAIAQAMSRRPTAPAAGRTGGSGGSPSTSAGIASDVTPRGHRDHGTVTPRDAAMTFAWASDVCDPEALGRLVYFDPTVRDQALAVLATMPAAIRTQYPTPEAFYGLLLAASCTEAPPPGADVMEQHMTVVELAPGRAATRQRGSERNVHEYQLTADGWKYVLPAAGVKGLPGILNSPTLAKLAQP